MSATSLNESVIKIFILVCFCSLLDGVAPSPLFFYNPFASPKTPDGESENVSIYTTTEANLEGKPSTQQPTIYQQIARNVLERIASPVVSHFILVGATDRSSRIVSTSPMPTAMSSQLEIVDDSVTETEDNFNSTERTDVQIEELENREETNPVYTKSNPSFNKTILRDNSKPERIVLYSNLTQETKNASEVDDLNMITGDFFDSISDLPDDDVDINEDKEVIDPDEIRRRTTERADDNSAEESEDDVEESTTERTSFKRNFYDDSRVIYVLELVGSVYAILTGLFQTLFNRNTM